MFRKVSLLLLVAIFVLFSTSISAQQLHDDLDNYYGLISDMLIASDTSSLSDVVNDLYDIISASDISGLSKAIDDVLVFVLGLY